MTMPESGIRHGRWCGAGHAGPLRERRAETRG